MTSYRAVPRNKLEADLEAIREQIARVEAEIESIRAEASARLIEPLKAIAALKQTAQEMADEVRDRQRRDAITPTISDHALLRYIERVHGIDCQALRDHLMTDAVLTAIKAGAATVRTQECNLIIKDMTVVTITAEERRPKPKKLSRARREEMEFSE